jgi:small subunit ribosomal protein S20
LIEFDNSGTLNYYFIFVISIFRRNILANLKSSAKRARQNIKRQARSSYYETTARSHIKRARAQIAANELEEARDTVQKAAKALDKAAQKGVIHRNNAARRKSNLMKALNKAQATAN